MKKSVLISFVLVALGAGVMAYARYATLSSDTVSVKIEQRLREKAQAGMAYCDKNGYNTSAIANSIFTYFISYNF